MIILLQLIANQIFLFQAGNSISVIEANLVNISCSLVKRLNSEAIQGIKILYGQPKSSIIF